MEKRRRVGAYGIVHDEQGRVLLVRSSERSNHPGVWYLPGGGLDHGEDPNAGVIRELKEETGLDVEIVGLRSVSSDLVEFPWRNVLLHHDRIVFDLAVTGGTLLSEVDGTTDLPKWVSPEELPELILVPFAASVFGLPARPEANQTVPPSVPDEAGEVAATGASLTVARKTMRFGAYGVVTDADGRVLLSLISDGYPGGGNWHLPGGGTDFGESPQEGLVREIFEETSQHGTVGRPLRVGHKHHPVAMGPEGEPYDWYTVRAIFEVFVPEPTAAVVTEAAGGSTARSAWFTRDELGQLPLSDLARGELQHIDQ
ncbi:NUDIX hydrolase [Catelliglobosispora koreensis]|uniref:NUDIX hydrolase n=1 Tax=Catelliglobosispora koreensis TaxID=129052 RepID=UPI00036FAB51|nr:NUDIX domain-containing protein [Catelliglobosispora koreensis]